MKLHLVQIKKCFLRDTISEFETKGIICHLYVNLLLSFRRGFVFGLWSACASVGNILGAFLASSVLKYGYEVRHTLLYFGDTCFDNILSH